MNKKKVLRKYLTVISIVLICILDLFCIVRSINARVVYKNRCHQQEALLVSPPYKRLMNRGSEYYYGTVSGNGFMTDIQISHTSYKFCSVGDRFVIDVSPRHIENPEGFKNGVTFDLWYMSWFFVVWGQLLFVGVLIITIFIEWLNKDDK